MILLGCIDAANVAVWKSLQAFPDGWVAFGEALKRYQSRGEASNFLKLIE
jgi:hypothetical protein